MQDINNENTLPLIEVTLKKIENEMAVVQMNDGQTISLPKHKIPQNIQIGNTFKLKPLDSVSESQEHENLAKNILNQIFLNK